MVLNITTPNNVDVDLFWSRWEHLVAAYSTKLVIRRSKHNVNGSTSASNMDDRNSSFYWALSYIKLYRSQPKPEFVCLSDTRIPAVVSSDMVRHDMQQLVQRTTVELANTNDC